MERFNVVVAVAAATGASFDKIEKIIDCITGNGPIKIKEINPKKIAERLNLKTEETKNIVMQYLRILKKETKYSSYLKSKNEK